LPLDAIPIPQVTICGYGPAPRTGQITPTSLECPIFTAATFLFYKTLGRVKVSSSNLPIRSLIGLFEVIAEPANSEALPISANIAESPNTRTSWLEHSIISSTHPERRVEEESCCEKQQHLSRISIPMDMFTVCRLASELKLVPGTGIEPVPAFRDSGF